MTLINERIKKGLTQSQLGLLVGVSRVTISNLERGVYLPSLPLAFKISKVLDSSIEEIFGSVET